MSPPNFSRTSKILVALDGSPAAATALPVARTIAGQLGCGVEVAHVVDKWMPTHLARRSLGVEAPDTSVCVLVGNPVEQLLCAANDRRVALVALTTHGGALEEGRELSHVALEVASAARHPTLLVRPEAVADLDRPYPAVRRFLFPFDGSAATGRALKPAVKLVSALEGSLDLLYVAHSTPRALGETRTMRPPMYMDEPYHEWPAWASEVPRWLASCCGDVPDTLQMTVHVRSEVQPSGVATAILDFARSHASDAIILVRRSRMERGHAPVLRAILRATPCPVLLTAGQPPRRPLQRCWAGELAGERERPD
jgi:nucleotide-binding universal stress UspA family protein